MAEPTTDSASHRTALLLAVVALAERGLSYSRGNLNMMGLTAFLFVFAGLALLMLTRGRWQGRADTVGGFRFWPVALPLVYFYLFATSAGRHILVFPTEILRVILRHLTLSAAVLALPLLLLALPSVRARLQPRLQVLIAAVPLLPVVVFFLLVPFVSPLARIDVYHVQAQGAEALLRFVNPYEITFQNTYAGPELYPGGVADSYPYPPLSFLPALIGHALGDIRWPQIAAHAAAAVLLFAAARARRLPAVESMMLAGMFFYLPHAPFVSEQAWTDPTVVLALAASSLLLARRQQGRALWAVGVALALKQTMVLLLPPLWALWQRFDRRAWTALLAVSAVSYGLFFLWDPVALWDDLVAFHLATPFRDNALTLSAFFNWMKLGPLPSWVSVIGLALGAATAVYRLRRLGRERTPVDAEAVSLLFAGFAFAWLLTLLLSKHAFMNYYYTLHFLILSALLWSRADDVERFAPEGA